VLPPPASQRSQVRTVSAWGQRTQADLARLSVLVVGAGSVGLDVAQRLAASGLQRVGVMDFDSVEEVNLDRMIGASRADVRLHRGKAEVATRLMRQAGTASAPRFERHEVSICTPEGLAIALDYDLIFSCVDRPWPRGVLNTIAYADLIPVIDGGIAIDAFVDGEGMRSATWRTHVLRPGRPCLVCIGQLDPGSISLDRSGALDDPSYIMGTDPALSAMRGAPNVALLAGAVSSSLLAQFVSFMVAPGGEGDPGPLQYNLATHSLEHLNVTSLPNCAYEVQERGEHGRIPLVGEHKHADEQIARRTRDRGSWACRLGEFARRMGAVLGGQ
ncbi:MAG: ThiF family adenylyltransferase, partial [Propionibacteriaceae bacterium]